MFWEDKVFYRLLSLVILDSDWAIAMRLGKLHVGQVLTPSQE